MKKRKMVLAANWKMNMTLIQVERYMEQLNPEDWPENIKVILAPPFPFLGLVKDCADERSLPLEVAAQNCHHEKWGAFTGEVSASMLQSIGVDWVIVGHSERRKYARENAGILVQKVKEVLSQSMGVIWCCGESLEDRKSGNHEAVVLRQIEEELLSIETLDWKRMIIAYEPIWAIGTGEVATPEQAEKMHQKIRSKIPEEVRSGVQVIYGGSMKPDNAAALLKKADIDGGLVGGASLDADAFQELIKMLQ